MNFREKLQSVLQKLGLTAQAKANALTSEQWNSIVDAYKKEYQTNLKDDMDAENPPEATTETAAITDEDAAAALQILNAIVDPSVEQPTNVSTEAPVTAPVATTENQPTQQPVATAAPSAGPFTAMAKRVATLFNQMAATTTQDKPLAVITSQPNLCFQGPGTTAKHLYGIEDAMFSMDKRWNKLAVNPASVTGDPTAADSKLFLDEVQAYTSSLKERYNFLKQNNMLDAKRLAAGEFSTNYDGLADAKVGNQYVILRQDALIARVLAKRDLTAFFPVRYGVQDHDLVFNAFFTEVSQAYQSGEIFKGSMKIEPEMGYVDDCMIKLKFGPMKDLERTYLAYLNKEGSDPIKWSMIEFNVLNSLEVAQVEQNKRRMRGIYVKPETGVAGSYLTAGTGIIYTLVRYFHELKLKLHDAAEYRSYTSANFLDVVQAFIQEIQMSVTEDMDLDSHCIYLNKLHQPWYIKNVREAYGKDTDFSGTNGALSIVPDTNIRIIWLPYMGPTNTLMFLQQPGNLQFLEYVPGEMLAMQGEQRMELVQWWSTWKEGTSAAFTGRKFATKAALDANGYEWQQIFMNKPATSMDADATTVDATKGFWHITAANTAAKAITDITGAKAGIAYVVECGNVTNATTIAKADKFSSITEAYTPTAVGDYIMVILDSTGKFLELERCVGGTRTINAALQPNIPGVR